LIPVQPQFPKPGGLCFALLPFRIQKDSGFTIRALDLSLVYGAPLHDSLLGSDNRAGWSQTKESPSISNDIDQATLTLWLLHRRFERTKAARAALGGKPAPTFHVE
jgi:hypothetical protein